MSGTEPNEPFTVHATAVSISGQGVLIRGASGSGKSALALDLIARGALLVSDDIVCVTPGDEGYPFVSTTNRMSGVIEARGVGLLRVPAIARAPLRLIVDMDHVETARLPERHSETIFGAEIATLRRVDLPHFPASILAMVQNGRIE